MEGLLSHILIEFLYNNRNGKLMFEHTLHGKSLRLVFEKYGVFDRCESYAEDILSSIGNQRADSSAPKQPIELQYTDGPFNTISVIMTDKHDETFAEYVPSMSEFIGNRNNICIRISSSSNFHELSGLLMHELQHAYEDMCLRKSGSGLEEKGIKSGYYKNLSSKMTKDKVKTLKWCLYMLSKQEQNAYKANILDKIESCQEKFLSITDSLEYVKSNTHYKVYDKVFEFAMSMDKTEDEKTREDMLDYANIVMKGKFSTFGQLTKWLRNQAWKAKSKLDRLIPKILYDKLSGKIPNVMWPSGNEDMILEILDKAIQDLKQK